MQGLKNAHASEAWGWALFGRIHCCAGGGGGGGGGGGRGTSVLSLATGVKISLVPGLPDLSTHARDEKSIGRGAWGTRLGQDIGLRIKISGLTWN